MGQVRPIMERFEEKLERIPFGGCWVWMASLKNGYGSFTLGKNHKVYAHRFAYECLVGTVPAGLELDHLCRNPSCANPSHLEAVTHAENIRRGENQNRLKTHCPAGHPYALNATVSSRPGRRQCKLCHRASKNRWYAARRSANA